MRGDRKALERRQNRGNSWGETIRIGTEDMGLEDWGTSGEWTRIKQHLIV